MKDARPKFIVTTIRLPLDVHAALQEAAQEMDRSSHWIMVQAIREWLGRRQASAEAAHPEA